MARREEREEVDAKGKSDFLASVTYSKGHHCMMNDF